jgi:hypothetical protein
VARPAAYRLYGTDLVWEPVSETWNHPGGGATTLFRQPITIPEDGTYTLYVNGENWRVWLSGDESAALSEVGAGAKSVVRNVELSAGDVMFAGTATNYGVTTRPSDNVSWLMWSLATYSEDPAVVPTVIARSEPSTVRVAYEPDPWPGVTAGLILDTALTEAQARGMLPNITWTFTDALDSNGSAWTQLISHEFRVQLIGRLIEDVAGLLDVEVWATPTGEIRAVPSRGTDKTATVTVDLPFGRRLSGEGPRITRAVFETPVGMGADHRRQRSDLRADGRPADVGHRSVHLTERPRVTVTEPTPCPSPWAWYHPDDRTGADGTTVTYHEDRSGNGRHLAPLDTSKVKVRTVSGKRLLYHEEAFMLLGDQLSVGHDGNPIDIDGTPATLDGPAFTVWAELIDPVDDDQAAGHWGSFGLHLAVGTASSFDDGVPFAFARSTSNLFGATAPGVGRHVLAFRLDTVRDSAELLIDGTVVASDTNLDTPGWEMWGVVLQGLKSTTGGLGEVIMWDEWVEDGCLPS